MNTLAQAHADPEGCFCNCFYQDVVYMDELGNECTILAAKTAKTLAQVGGSTHKSITFSFDRCYGAKITTADIYNEIPYSLVQVRG